ncbi:MAG TPA: hypothetical protein VND95_06180 [Stellaceae bacterium]|nr:hypothetical protein [Stellaceae bacterium]
MASGTALAACPAGKTRRCVNLDQVPQISQQIVASEPVAARAKAAPLSEPSPGYTGVTFGAVPNSRRAPEVGYRWAVN